MEQRHLETVKALIPLTRQSSVLSFVKTRCNEIEDICNGVFLLSELSDRTKDKIVSYGEWLSSQIVYARLLVRWAWTPAGRIRSRTDRHRLEIPKSMPRWIYRDQREYPTILFRCGLPYRATQSGFQRGT